MSLNTLLEAAKYLEMQEQKEQQHKAAIEAALALSKASIPPQTTTTTTTNNKYFLNNTTYGPYPVAITQKINNGTVLITTATNEQQTTITDQPLFKIKKEPITLQQHEQQQQQQPINNALMTQIEIKNEPISQLPPSPLATATTTTTTPPPATNNTPIISTTKQISINQPIINTAAPPKRILHNSFDIMNPLVIDESDTRLKRRQPPLAFRAGTREVHNKLEKHRRAHLKECFDVLKKQLPPTLDDKKSSNLSILHSALRYIQTLKRRERELEHEMERLARDKISAQQRLAMLKRDITSHYDNVDFSKILPETITTTLPTTTTSTTPRLPLSTTITATTTGTPTILTNNKNNNNNNNNDEDIDIDEKVSIKLSPITNGLLNGVGNNDNNKLPIPLLSNSNKATLLSSNQIKELQQQQQQPQQQQQLQQTAAALSVLPVGYPVSQGLVLQKLIVPKAITDLPLVSTHFITQQQLNGKVVPLVNAQYVVKPVVVVSRPR